METSKEQTGGISSTAWSANSATGRMAAFCGLTSGQGVRWTRSRLGAYFSSSCASVLPWPDYSRLKEQIAASEPVHGEFVGNPDKFYAIWDAVCSKGMLERAAPELLALQARYTSKTPEGFDLIRFPEDTP